ncbi:hypothetical protein WICPIJ_002753 [Wickerhamomyces pijperi]|uniref:Uncharacterized protein n=1 Tax=Wickerhamomyces pijperi TaxID=599730 RepID=A0A9P8TPV5_WICPI|nr:hypothetical protein WICPIJ_002753 [Wickerhamomyces pijperi]
MASPRNITASKGPDLEFKVFTLSFLSVLLIPLIPSSELKLAYSSSASSVLISVEASTVLISASSSSLIFVKTAPVGEDGPVTGLIGECKVADDTVEVGSEGMELTVDKFSPLSFNVG